jgi:hypothetical protein
MFWGVFFSFCIQVNISISQVVIRSLLKSL